MCSEYHQLIGVGLDRSCASDVHLRCLCTCDCASLCMFVFMHVCVHVCICMYVGA